MGSLKIYVPKHGEHKVLFDDEDFDLVMSMRWVPLAKPQNRTIYAVSYKSIKGRQIATLMHRVILGVVDSKMHTDHINGNGLDNRRVNLRVCTTRQNIANQQLSKNNTSGYKGVFKLKNCKKDIYQAKITVMRKDIYIGYYPTAELAAEAYNKAAIEYYGEFAYLNPLKKSLQCNHNTNTYFRVIDSLDAVDSGNYGYCKSCQPAFY